MGEWGTWWSSRGSDTTIKCEFCGSKVPKHKAVEVRLGMRLTSDIYEVADYVSMPSRKGYACISCAKHRGFVKDGIHTTVREKREKERERKKREMDKVMRKVEEIEKTEKDQGKKGKVS